MPANSAQVVPRFAITSAVTASAAQRTPKRSRTSPASPCPVAMPVRAPSSWKTISASVEISSTQSSE